MPLFIKEKDIGNFADYTTAAGSEPTWSNLALSKKIHKIIQITQKQKSLKLVIFFYHESEIYKIFLYFHHEIEISKKLIHTLKTQILVHSHGPPQIEKISASKIYYIHRKNVVFTFKEKILYTFPTVSHAYPNERNFSSETNFL